MRRPPERVRHCWMRCVSAMRMRTSGARHLWALCALALCLPLLAPLAACAPLVSVLEGPAGVITFGATVSITGPDVAEGHYALDGYQFYINTINKQGGLLIGGRRYRVALDYYDDQSQPARVTQLYQKLITQDDVDFLLGPYSSLLTSAAVAVAERYGTPMIAPHGAADSSYPPGDKYTFSIVSPAGDYLRGVLALVLARDPTVSTVALLGSDEPFSHEVLAGAASYAEQRGMRVVYEGYYPQQPSDLSGRLAQIKATRPDVLLVSGHLQDAILATRQAHDLCLSPRAVGLTVGPEMSDFEANVGAQGDYIFGATQWTSALTYHGDDQWGTPQNYANAFMRAFPTYTEIPYQAAESTAALVVFQQALQAAGTLDPVAVRNALARTDMMTFYGRIRFDSRGINIYKPMVVTQLQPGGGNYTVFPTDVAQRAPLYPMPPCMGAA